MAGAVSESPELRQYMAFWDTYGERFQFNQPATSGTYEWIDSRWVLQANTPTVIYSLAGVRIELIGVNTVGSKVVAPNVRMNYDPLNCSAEAPCSKGTWTVLVAVDSVTSSVTLDSLEGTQWRLSQSIGEDTITMVLGTPGGKAQIVTNASDPWWSAETSIEIPTNGGPYKQTSNVNGKQYRFEYQDRFLEIDANKVACTDLPDDMLPFFPEVPLLLKIRNLEILTNEWIIAPPLE